MFDVINDKLIFVFLLGLVGLSLLFALWLCKRLVQLKSLNGRLMAETERDREIIASITDGLYVWDHENSAEKCSRRLAVLLRLDNGTEANFKNILEKFSTFDARILAEATEQLHKKGKSFRLLLNTEQRKIQTTGTRTYKLDGSPLNDLIWMRDITNEASIQLTHKTSDEVAAHEHFRQLLNTLPLPVWIRDDALVVVFSNEAEKRVKASNVSTQIARAARTKNEAVSDHTKIDSSPFIVSEIPAYAWSGTIGFAEKQIIKNNNSKKWDSETKIKIARDEVLENLNTAIAIFGSNKRLSFFNKAYAILWQFDAVWLNSSPSLSEIVDRLRDTRQLPEVIDFRKFKEEQKNLFNSLKKPIESLLHLPDGRALRFIVGPCTTGGLIFSYENVSQRLNLERSLKSLNAVQSETLDNLYEGVAVFGSDGRLKLSNPAFSQLWGISQSDLAKTPHLGDFINKTRNKVAGIEKLNDEDWLSYSKNTMNQYFSRQSTSGRVQLLDGRTLDYSSVPLPDGAVLLNYLDISDSARVESALRQRADAMDQANHLKSEFIASVSYEVRTPLTTLKGFAEILTQEYFGKLNNRQREYCQGILDSSEDLTTVINNILDMASIEAGVITLELDTIEIHAMLASVLNLIKERVRRKELVIDFQCPSNIGWIVADEKRLKQVIFYLLSNAVNMASPRSKVRLETHRNKKNQENIVSFNITSFTNVIKPTEQKGIFSELNDSHKGGSHKQKHIPMGAGLELALVQRFVELHGGEVEVKSPQGKGTIITCRIPASGRRNSDLPDINLASG